MDKSQLDEILKEHAQALQGIEGAKHAELYEQNLNNVDFREYEDLTLVNFENSNLQGANFAGCNLTNVNFSRCNLIGVDFTNCNMSAAKLSHSNLYGAKLDGVNVFDITDIRGTNGDGKYIKTISISKYRIAYTKHRFAVGGYSCGLDDAIHHKDRWYKGEDYLWWLDNRDNLKQFIIDNPAEG